MSHHFHHADIPALHHQMLGKGHDGEALKPDSEVLARIQQVVRSEVCSQNEQRIQGDVRTQQRQAGRELLSLAVQYAARQDDAEAILARARANGQQTGRRLAQLNYSLHEMIEAYFAYAGRIEQLILPEVTEANGLNAKQHRVEQRLRYFFQQVLLAMADTFTCEFRG